ncbi:MAG: DUF2071 domain-containing protein [Leptospirales bacterium]|nr:DUF2071 domain-containing protein [Leptospirales bacterium]
MRAAGRLLQSSAHRPYALPPGPWIMRQNWHDLLFAHWPVPVKQLRALIPEPLEIDQDTEGRAWIAVVPFWMSGIRLRATPPLPGLSRFPEINVRSYVRHGGKPGVWFFSLDAHNRLAVAAARQWFYLNYFNSHISIARSGEGIRYHAQRRDRRAGGGEFLADYAPADAGFQAQAGSLEYFLAERYCLYAGSRDGRLFRAEVHHPPWPLQRASAQIERNSMTEALGIHLEGPPHLLFARKIETIVWAPHRIH